MTAERKTVLHNFCAVPAVAMQAPCLNKEARTLLAISKAVDNATGVAIISQARIATLTGLSERSVYKALIKLEADGVLTIHDRGRRERGCYKVKAYALDYSAPSDTGRPADQPSEHGVHTDAVDNRASIGTRGSDGPSEHGVPVSIGTRGSEHPDRLNPDPSPVPDPQLPRGAPAGADGAAADGHNDAGQHDQTQASVPAETPVDGMQGDASENGEGGGNTPPVLPLVDIKALTSGAPSRDHAKKLRGGGWKALANADVRQGADRMKYLDAQAADECQRRLIENNEDAKSVLMQLAEAARAAGEPKWRPWCGVGPGHPEAQDAPENHEAAVLHRDDPRNDRPDPTEFPRGNRKQESRAKQDALLGGGAGEPIADGRGRAFKGSIFQEYQAAQHRADAAMKALMQEAPGALDFITAQNFEDAAVEEVYEPGCAYEMFRNILERKGKEASCDA